MKNVFHYVFITRVSKKWRTEKGVRRRILEEEMEGTPERRSLSKWSLRMSPTLPFLPPGIYLMLGKSKFFSWQHIVLLTPLNPVFDNMF
jgi:hypothetical protein